MEGFLLQATIYLGTAVIAVPIASRLGLGSVLGYLLAGILIGPSVLGLIQEAENLLHFAEFGVVMMLFIIGLELEPRTLWDMRHKLLGLGGLQIILTVVAVALTVRFLGQPWSVAFAVGMILSLSSTAIVLQTLTEKGLTQTAGGRSTFAVLLTQDVAVIPMLALLPLLSFAAPVRSHDDGHGRAMSLVDGPPGWGVTLVTIGAVGGIVLVGIFLVRPLFKFIHVARLREMYTALALLIVVGIAFVMTLVGLSPALGAFLAGVVLANSEFRHELESDVEPFKGLLLGLFFITVGAGVNFNALFADFLVIIGLTLGLMALKGLVLFVLSRAFAIKGNNGWLFTLGLAQAGEFGFVLISFSRQQNVLPTALSERLLLVVALSMLLTPLFFIAYERLAIWLREPETQPEHDLIDEQHSIIIAGVGRFGQVVNRLVQSAGFNTTVLDHDIRTIELIRAFGTKAFFGDPTRPEILHAAGLNDAKVLVVALDDPNAAVKLVQYAREHRPDIHIIARASDRMQVFRLYRAGADDIVRELFDSSLRAGRYVLEHLGLTDFEAHEAEAMYYQLDREALAELAELWDPNIPIQSNKAYMKRARELNKELETALLAQKTRE
jgi:CPA2 family monovalent cation:H+ antiporter-2